MLDALARFADRRAKLAIGLATVFFLIAAGIGSSVADKLDPYGVDDPGTESVKATNVLEHSGYRSTAVVVLVQGVRVESRAGRARVTSLERSLRGKPDVKSVSGFYDTRSRAFVSKDGRSTYLAVALRQTGDKDLLDAAERIKNDLKGQPGVLVGGPAVVALQVNDQVSDDLKKAETLAFPLLFLLSLLFFRSLVAALLPVLIGGLSITGTSMILSIVSETTSVSVFALNLATGLGLGLALDYSLFIVSRYREEIAKSGPGLPALRATLATAGRTVVFSSLTVALALAALLAFPQPFLRSMGLSGALVVLFAAAATLTVLPAVLGLLGTRVNSLAPKFLARRAERDAVPAEQGFWYRLSRFVMRRPVPIAVVTAAVLIVAGLPVLGIKFTGVDARILPKDASARQVYDVMQSQYPPYRDTPIQVVVQGGGAPAAVRLRQEISQVPGIDDVLPPQTFAGGVTLINAFSGNPTPSDESKAAVRRIRALAPPQRAAVLVTGTTAGFVDFQDSLADHLPVVIAIIVGSMLILLFLMTGSVVLPVKSLLMNVLNLSAVFGILVLVFQDGRLEGPLDYTSQGALDQNVPILLFAVAFGLSTDYAVFLLSRIKEARDNGASDSECVAIGLERTGRIVTAAALMFAVAIGAFAVSKILFIKANGLGTALAVLIDASIIRALLVPSLMEILGKWNWWAPSWLRRWHGRSRMFQAPPARQSVET
jgi:uncharacterized membrane protein YdfJ with MMPL/SSD domain